MRDICEVTVEAEMRSTRRLIGLRSLRRGGFCWETWDGHGRSPHGRTLESGIFGRRIGGLLSLGLWAQVLAEEDDTLALRSDP
jgi:hypothetical protein